MKVEQSIRFAQTSLKNGSATKSEKSDATTEAQAAGVTNFDYLKTLTLLRATNSNVQVVAQWLED